MLSKTLMKKIIIALFFIVTSLVSHSQIRTVSGEIIDELTKEPIGFASVSLKVSKNGKTADSSGHFQLNANFSHSDTLIVSYVGYQEFLLPIDSIKTENPIVIFLLRKEKSDEVVVKLKINKGLFVWKKIMARKKQFNRYNLNNFSYEAYNKIEVDIKNFNTPLITKNFLFKPFDFVFKNIDSTSEEKPFLPAYLIESISDYAFQKKPKKYFENIKAINTKGFSNESFNKLLGVMNQNLNIFSNYINVISRDFISPFNDNADIYYHFSVADTQMVNNKKVFHFIFKPKRAGENTFDGEAWVEAGTFELHKISMYLGKDANINFISRIGIVQEFKKINDSTFFLNRDKFFADFNTLDKNSLTLIGRKSTSYKNIIINSDSISNLFVNQKGEELIKTNADSSSLSEEEWSKIRHDSLSVNEKKIYKTLDSLIEMPKFQKLQTTLKFLGTGYRNVGNLEIGPWYNWFSSNPYEGYRFRFDLGTNAGFNKKIYLHGYLAYGTKDNDIKGKIEAYWNIQREPKRLRLHLSFSDDIENGISSYGEVSQDNIFSLAIKKPNVDRKFIRLQETRFDIAKDLGSGFSSEIIVASRKFTPLLNLPSINDFINKQGEALNTFDLSFKLRFAYLEKFVSDDFFRYSLGSKYPIVEVIYTKGIPRTFNSSYDYTKISASIDGDFKINPLGSVVFRTYGGIVKGTTPFVFLENHLGNDIYYYNKSSLNLMNRFEYVSDKYAGINFEHKFGSGIFRFFSITRKLKWRQFWNVKNLWGSLSSSNMSLNGNNTYFKSLNGKSYTEVGTGIDNIFRVFRVDLVWRLSNNPSILPRASRFGVFGSFQFQF